MGIFEEYEHRLDKIRRLLDESMTAERSATRAGRDATLYINRRGAFGIVLAILNDTTLETEYARSRERTKER